VIFQGVVANSKGQVVHRTDLLSTLCEIDRERHSLTGLIVADLIFSGSLGQKLAVRAREAR
jgi:hypothetical protein